MALSYLKLFDEFEEYVTPFDDAQRGRLFSAMMAYAFHGEEHEFPAGSPESFIWPVIRRKIDCCEKKAQRNRENGKNGGRPSSVEEKPKETEKNRNEANGNDAYNHEQDQEHEHEQDQEHEHEQDQDQEQEKKNRLSVTTCAPAADGIYACARPDEDLTQDIARSRSAQAMIRRYGLTDNEATLSALMEDMAKYGEERVNNALGEAALSDHRGGISVRFYRAILSGSGGNGPGRGKTGGTGDTLMRQSRAERSASIRAAMVDLDAEVGDG